MTRDRKTQKIKRELKQLAKELERTEHEREEIERGKAQEVRARNKLRELREYGLGSFSSKGARRSTLMTDVVYWKPSFNPAMITLPFPAVDVL